MTHKLCKFCFTNKKNSDFYVIEGNRYHNFCKECTLLRAKLHFSGDEEKKQRYLELKRKHAKAYRAKHSAEISDYYKAWYKRTNRYRPRPDGTVADRANIAKYAKETSDKNELITVI